MNGESKVSELRDRIEANMSVHRFVRMNAVFLCVDEDDAPLAYVRFVDGTPEIGSGGTENPDMTIHAAADLWPCLMSGEMPVTQALVEGKVYLSGDVALGVKLSALLEPGASGES